MSEDQWGDLECMYKACQARTCGGLCTDTDEDERGENDYEMKTFNIDPLSELH